ncbi:MAG: hypothetical protein ACFFC7_22275 [Candidatus Hermodarchaeota archaeon]
MVPTPEREPQWFTKGSPKTHYTSQRQALLGDTFVPIFSFSPGGLTFLIALTCLSVPFSPKQFILSSSYAPDSSQVEDRKVVGEFNL